MSLRKFPSWALVGNDLSSRNALSPAFSTQPPISQPLRTTLKLGEPVILGIAIGACVLGFILIAVLVILCRSKKESGSEYSGKMEGKELGLKKKTSERQDKSSKIVFFEGSNLAFDLEDLLRASAEVLGKGTFGTTYKAALEDPTTVVVKRVKEVSVGRRDFEQQMEVIGNIRHENVAPLRAYFYSKDDKLMVYDYYSQGSVSSILHGNRQENRTPLDWESRLRIAIGAARGMAHIHAQCGGKLVHGNIKASNIFLNPQGYGCLSDIGLVALMSPMAPQAMRAAGYRAPELTDSRKASHASDVFSFGVFLLELLTGKSPIHAVGGDEVVHLVRWVNSVVREEWTAEVFDVELLRFPNIEEEMVEMLQIAMACVVRMPEQRPKTGHLVKMVEGVKRGATPLTPPPADIAFSSAQHSEIISSAILRSQLGSSSSATQ